MREKCIMTKEQTRQENIRMIAEYLAKGKTIQKIPAKKVKVKMCAA